MSTDGDLMLLMSAALVLSFLSPLPVEQGQPKFVKVGEFTIRRVATKKPLPTYPPESVAKKRTGVAVAAIRSDVNGQVVEARVLEAPDEAIGAAVRDALRTWLIPPMKVAGDSEPYGVTGKVTFYFQIVEGRGRVSNPEDLPGGPKPEPAGGPPTSPPGVRPGGPPPSVASSAHSAPDLEIDESQFKRLLAATPPPIVLDVRERADFARAPRDGAINIPADEVAVRSWIEIDRTRPVIIDCSRTETMYCQAAARMLTTGPKPVRVAIFLP
jgi:rhodanese-related sulfurtransferase